MILETNRLILRHWQESDADILFEYASDPDVGPIAGWPVHESREYSLDVIRNVFNGPECYAVCHIMAILPALMHRPASYR